MPAVMGTVKVCGLSVEHGVCCMDAPKRCNGSGAFSVGRHA